MLRGHGQGAPSVLRGQALLTVRQLSKLQGHLGGKAEHPKYKSLRQASQEPGMGMAA